MRLSVILCTRNPRLTVFRRVIEALCGQTFDINDWELVLVDNASTPPVRQLAVNFPKNTRHIHCESPGISRARLAGIDNAKGDIAIYVDDDNVLTANYLKSAANYFESNSDVWIAGGWNVPEFEVLPPKWYKEIFPLLALSTGLKGEAIKHPGSGRKLYPPGAGLVFTRKAAHLYRDICLREPWRIKLKRCEDLDFVQEVYAASGIVASVPDLELTHLIPAGRVSYSYAARLLLESASVSGWLNGRKIPHFPVGPTSTARIFWHALHGSLVLTPVRLWGAVLYCFGLYRGWRTQRPSKPVFLATK